MTSEQLEMLEYDALLEYDDSEDTILEDLYGVKQEVLTAYENPTKSKEIG